MAIDDRTLPAGTPLRATYKGTVHTAEVVATEDGLRYRLADGRTFKSPSSAGKAVMDGKACNGWVFWSLDPGSVATAPQQPAGEPAQPQPKASRGKSRSKTAPAQTEETATA